MASVAEVLDMDAMTTLAEDEAIIERGMASFVEVGEALMRIKEDRKYADEFESFEEYCDKRWGMSGSHVRTTMAASRAVAIATAHNLPAPPTVEAAKPLVKLYNEAGQFDRRTNDVRNPKAAERAVVQVMARVAKAKQKEAAAAPEAKLKPITGRDVQKAIGGGATSRKPGWFELLGQVGDDLKAMQNHLAKAEQAITRAPNDDLRAKAGQYAEWADDIAARLRQIQEMK